MGHHTVTAGLWPVLAIPAAARGAWSELAAALDERGPAPCESSSAPEVWWSNDEEAVGLALRCCRSCPVVEQCREYAVGAGERYGTWGATTERERAGRG